MQEEIERFYPDAESGLTEKQVESRFKKDLVNHNCDVPTKSIRQIIKDNTFTLFNLLNIVLGIAVFLVGSYKNMLFLGVMFCNVAISIFQEVRAKRTIDKLSIISSTKVTVVRNRKKEQLPIHKLVLDDVIELKNGNQVPSDCILIDGECDVNESLLTGESDAIHKTMGEQMLSGSYLVSGKCRARVERIGADNYAAGISAQAKYIKKINSEILSILNQIIKVLTFVIIPLGIILFIRQYGISIQNVPNDTFSALHDAVVQTVASVIGMIPEGLILLTSTVLAVSVIRLSKYNVLVQELYCIEMLARVDVLCLDKTGTITEGSMEVSNVVSYNSYKETDIHRVMCGLTAALQDTNATFMALNNAFHHQSDLTAVRIIPFSSEKKWSGAYFGEDEGSYIIGAAEFVLKEIPQDLQKILEQYSRGYRALILAHSPNDFNERNLPENIEVCGVILIVDKIRQEAPKTLRYFDEEGVTIKVISGDNPITVSEVARRAGVKNYDRYVDATTLKTYDDIKEAIENNTVFGRVTPAQKKDFVIALKEYGHTVAMTGDGVNDVLALKEADCSIAMASGSDAARSVAQLVLLDSNFASMPKVVAEGRRSVNNIQRSATLFIVKTIFSTILAFLFLFLPWDYPFQPIQLTLVNAFTIGIPSFFLALQPNKDRIKGAFILNILEKSIPAGITTVLGIVLCIIAYSVFGLSYAEYSTLAVCITAITAMMILLYVSLPLNWFRGTLYALMLGGLSVGVLFFHKFYFLPASIRTLFSFAEFTPQLALIFAVIFAICLIIFILLTLPMKKLNRKLTKTYIQRSKQKQKNRHKTAKSS